MKVKDMIKVLQGYEDDREVVLHYWNGEDSKFIPLELACTPTANTKNLLVLIESKCFEEPIR